MYCNNGGKMYNTSHLNTEAKHCRWWHPAIVFFWRQMKETRQGLIGTVQIVQKGKRQFVGITHQVTQCHTKLCRAKETGPLQPLINISYKMFGFHHPHLSSHKAYYNTFSHNYIFLIHFKMPTFSRLYLTCISVTVCGGKLLSVNVSTECLVDSAV